MRILGIDPGFGIVGWAVIEDSLKALQTDYIDIMIIRGAATIEMVKNPVVEVENRSSKKRSWALIKKRAESLRKPKSRPKRFWKRRDKRPLIFVTKAIRKVTKKGSENTPKKRFVVSPKSRN